MLFIHWSSSSFARRTIESGRDPLKIVSNWTMKSRSVRDLNTSYVSRPDPFLRWTTNRLGWRIRPTYTVTILSSDMFGLCRSCTYVIDTSKATTNSGRCCITWPSQMLYIPISSDIYFIRCKLSGVLTKRPNPADLGGDDYGGFILLSFLTP